MVDENMPGAPRIVDVNRPITRFDRWSLSVTVIYQQSLSGPSAVSPHFVRIKQNRVPVALQTSNDYDFAGYPPILSGGVAPCRWRKRICRIENKIDRVVSDSSEARSFPLDVPQLSALRSRLRQNFRLVVTRPQQPSGRSPDSILFGAQHT